MRWDDERWDVRCLKSGELRNGLLPAAWESTRRRQLVSQFWSLDKWRGHQFAKVPQEILLRGNLEDIAPTVDFTCTRPTTALSVDGDLWSATSLESGPSGLKSNALPTRLPLNFTYAMHIAMLHIIFRPLYFNVSK